MTVGLWQHPSPTQSLPLRQWPPVCGQTAQLSAGKGNTSCWRCAPARPWALFFFSRPGDASDFVADLGERMKGWWAVWKLHCRPCTGGFKYRYSPWSYWICLFLGFLGCRLWFSVMLPTEALCPARTCIVAALWCPRLLQSHLQL